MRWLSSNGQSILATVQVVVPHPPCNGALRVTTRLKAGHFERESRRQPNPIAHSLWQNYLFFVQLFTWCSANALSSTFYPLYYPSLSYVISSLNLNHYIYSGAYMLCVACASNSQEKVSCATLHIRHKLRATLQHVHRFTRNLHIVSAIVNHSILVS